MSDSEIVGTMMVGGKTVVAYNKSGEALYIEPGYESMAEALLETKHEAEMNIPTPIERHEAELKEFAQSQPLKDGDLGYQTPPEYIVPSPDDTPTAA